VFSCSKTTAAAEAAITKILSVKKIIPKGKGEGTKRRR